MDGEIKKQSNVLAFGKQRDITQEVPQKVLEIYARFCIGQPPQTLEALILTALHAKAFHDGVTGKQVITIEFDPEDGPYFEGDDLPIDGPMIIRPDSNRPS